MLPENIVVDVQNFKEKQKFPLVSAAELTKEPRPIHYLIKGYIPEKSLIELFGSPGSGKSFVALDIAFCIANGIPWHGRRTKQGTVILIIGEGFAGIGQRLRALELIHDQPTNNLIVSKQPASLTDEQNAAWVADAIHEHEPVLIVIDTISRNFGGADENSTQAMAAFITNIDHFIKGNAAVMLVHHSGHAEKGRARGSSVLNGAVDCEYCITRNENVLTVQNTKAKEFEPPPGLSFSMTPQELDWTDEDGLLINSIVLTEVAWKQVEETKSLSARNEAILASLHRAIDAHGINPTNEIKKCFGGFGSDNSRKIVHTDYWRKEAYRVIDVDPNGNEMEAKRKAFNRAKEALRKNHIQTMDGFWWVIHD